MTELVRLDNAHTYRYGFQWRYPRIPRFTQERFYASTELPRLFDRNPLVIVDHSSDPIDQSVHLEFERTADQLGLSDRIITITSDWLMRDHDPRTVWWPMAMDLVTSYHGSRAVPQIGARQHRVGCLNGMPRAHRFLALHLLEQAGLDQDAVIVCHGLRHLYLDQDLAWDHAWFQDLPQEVRQRLTQDAYRRHWPGSSWHQDQHGVSHAAFSACALNLVTETDMGRSLSPTEKSVKPMLAGQLWIMIAQPGMNQVLRELGFHCHDQDIPHDRYDLVEPWPDRVRAAVDLLAEIWPHVHDIYQRSTPALEHNQQLARSSRFRDMIRRGLRDLDLIREQPL